MDVQALLDEREIIRGLGRFARAAGEQQGIDALRANMRRFLDSCGGTQHLIGSILVDVEGDRATSRAYVQARHQRVDDPAGAIFDSNGEYVDQWERRLEGWRIVRRDALWAAHSGDPAILAAGRDHLG